MTRFKYPEAICPRCGFYAKRQTTVVDYICFNGHKFQRDATLCTLQYKIDILEKQLGEKICTVNIK